MSSDRQRLFGSILLVSGCCIGAGMLGLPVITALAGFLPSTLLLVVAWLFMCGTGLLLLEVYLYYQEEIGLVTMASRTLGPIGKAVCWITFLFLFYCLMVAYVAGSGSLIKEVMVGWLGMEPHPYAPPIFLTLILGIALFLGTQATDLFNRWLMMGLVVSYVLLVAFGLPHIEVANLTFTDWNEAFYIFPPLIVSFGYHNLVPGLATYLKKDASAVRRAILVGTGIPLLIYLFWETVILGMVPIDGPNGFRVSLDQGSLATEALRAVAGYSFVAHMATAFAFFAIVTSFLTVALSFIDFLGDGLKLSKRVSNKLLLCTLVLAPPLVFGLLDPTLFLKALNHAGGIGAVVLFGLLPCFMVWAGRYSKKYSSSYRLLGGRITLLALIVISLFILCFHIHQEFFRL